MSWACILTALAVVTNVDIYAQSEFDNSELSPDPTNKHLTTDAFKKFMKKFNPVDVFEKADKLQRARGSNFSLDDYTNMIFDGIDASAALLRLKVQNGNPKVLSVSSRRQYHLQMQTWTPPPGLSVYPKDRFNYRERLYELMKQAIYQARNKMVLMQMMREKYRHKKMYKMGYLIGKTDTACKIFSKVSYHAWRHCWRVQDWLKAEAASHFRYNMYDMMLTHMRVLQLWFQAELLTDLVIKNDVQYHESYAIKGKWNYTD